MNMQLTSRCPLHRVRSVLEPLLHALLDPKVRRKAETISVEGVDLQIERYQHVFDMAQQQHVLDNLISLASFGGQGFTRLAKTTFFDQSPYPDLRQRAQSGKQHPHSALIAQVGVKPS